jgi:hypothetical protein
MRSLMVMAVLAWSPALAASPPLCTLPASSAIPFADDQAEPPTFAAHDQPSPPAAISLAHRPLPDTLASIPFLQHVAAAGAVVIDLGEAHGMRAVAARSGDQFMLFEVTPDGQAAVSGAMVDLTPAQLETIARGNITGLAVEHELSGLFVRSGPVPGVLHDTGQGAADPRCHVGRSG